MQWLSADKAILLCELLSKNAQIFVNTENVYIDKLFGKWHLSHAYLHKNKTTNLRKRGFDIETTLRMYRLHKLNKQSIFQQKLNLHSELILRPHH